MTVIVSGSQGIFFSSESHFQTLQQNASGYESIEHQLKMHVNTLETDLEREERRKNISGNASLFILFVSKKGCQKEAFAKVSPFFNVLQKCIHLSLCLGKTRAKRMENQGICLLIAVGILFWQMFHDFVARVRSLL